MQHQRIWDLSRISDREETRLEFPDLIRFKGDWFCTFREGDRHMGHPSGRLRIIRSSDGQDWDAAALLDWDGGDLRDPKLSITPEGHLMITSKITFVRRHPRPDGSHALLDTRPPGAPEPCVDWQSVTWISADGVDWGSAHACPTGANVWRWSTTWHNGMGYSVGYVEHQDGRTARSQGSLYRTRDGKNWRMLKENVLPDHDGNEASIVFDEDDTAYCVVRCQTGAAGALGVADPPHYDRWTWRKLQVDWDGDGRTEPAERDVTGPIRGPLLRRLSDGRFILASPVNRTSKQRAKGRPSLFLLDPRAAVLTLITEFEQGCSYMGLIEHDNMLWITCGERSAERGRRPAIILTKRPLPQTSHHPKES